MELQFPIPHVIELKASAQPWELSVTGPEQARLAQRAEALGYSMISVPEHFLIPQEHADLSGPFYYDATTTQAYLAGATTTMRLNSCVTVLPLHHPVALAKALATADWLSGGRITVTFGVGWLEREFELMRVPFHERGRMTDEYLESMIALWTQDAPSYAGCYVSFDEVVFEPKPVQRPHLPIWFGGDADAALRRVARHGSGWNPFLTKPEDIPARIDYIKSQPGYDGRRLDVMYGLGTGRVGEGHVVQDAPQSRPGMSETELVDRLGRFHELGVTMSAVPIPPVRDTEEYLDYAQWVIEQVQPQLPGQ